MTLVIPRIGFFGELRPDTDVKKLLAFEFIVKSERMWCSKQIVWFFLDRLRFAQASFVAWQSRNTARTVNRFTHARCARCYAADTSAASTIFGRDA